MLLNILLLVVGLVGLFFGGEWLVKGSSRLARSLGISALIVGLTVVSMGTSMPELLVSVNAALGGTADISVGNVIGSNIANIGLILGISGLVYPISVHVNLIRREIPIMIGVAAAASLMMLDRNFNRIDGLILLLGLAAFLIFMIFSARQEQKIKHNIPEDDDLLQPEAVNRNREGLRVLAGMLLLLVGARLTVDSAVALAQAVGISELVIGMTIVAIGTSLPELVTSVVAAMRQESDIAIGNVVGSNIFNFLAIMGITAVIQPIEIAERVMRFDVWALMAFSLLVLPFAMNRVLGRRESFFFLAAYIAYIVLAFTQN